jgi:hypothetical protein
VLAQQQQAQQQQAQQQQVQQLAQEPLLLALAQQLPVLLSAHCGQCNRAHLPE